MLTWLRKRRRRRAFSPVVVELPRLLAHRFGGKDAYSAGQVARALDILKIPSGSEAAACAHAIACTADEFTLVYPDAGAERRRELGREIATLFDLDEADLAMRSLRRAKIRTSFRTANSEEWSKYGGPGGHPHEGD